MALMAPSTVARRAAAALATAAVLCATAAPTAFADTPAPSAPSAPADLPKGLYGDKDPSFDGVWRQSLALLAQHTVGVEPAKEAIDWLAGQQCDDGAFTSYRADTSKACDKAKEDTNMTGVAVQALAALGGHSDGVKKAVDWLRSGQEDDGGWRSAMGKGSDANSTAVVIGALKWAGVKPEDVKKGDKSPYDALVSFQLGCDAKEDERGAFAFQPQDGALAPNNSATAAAVPAGLGEGYVVEPAGKDVDEKLKPPACADGDSKGRPNVRDAARAGAAYLASVLDKNDHHLPSAMPGAEDQPDVGGTASAVIALAAGQHGVAAQQPLKWLEKNSAKWAKAGGPAAYAQLILAAHATGTDPRDFGGADLVSQLTAMGPEPSATASPSAGPQKDAKQADDGLGVWWIVGVFFVASVGVGFLISGRKKKQI